MRRFAEIVGIAVLAIGLFTGFGKQEAYDGSSSVSCGAAFTPALGDAYLEDQKTAVAGPYRTNFVNLCRDKTGNRMVIGWALVGLGAAVALGASFLPEPRPTTQPD